MEHYKKCRYSGRKVNKNRSRAAFKRHHGEDNLTRRTVWREKARLVMCEDHFDMEKDMPNYAMYKMGFSHNVLVTNEAVPTKFHCQEDRKRRLSDPGFSRGAFHKRRRMELITECMQTPSESTPDTETHTENLPIADEIIEPEHEAQKSLTLKRHAIPSTETTPWNKKRTDTSEDVTPPADIERRTSESDHESQLQPCSCCLSYGRDLEPLGDLTDIYCTLVPRLENLSDVSACWECRAALQRCASFQKQAARARHVLTLTMNGTFPEITDNSRSLSTLDAIDVACMSVDPEVQTEDITAANVQPSVPEDRRHHNRKLDAMNVNTKAAKGKRKKRKNAVPDKQNPSDQGAKLNAMNVNIRKVVGANSTVQDTGAISVKLKVPAVAELEEPMCEIEDVELKFEDPLEIEGENHDSYNAPVGIKIEPKEIVFSTSIEKKLRSGYANK